MKTASFLPILFVSLSLMISACTPKDNPVTDPGTRAKILEQNNKKNGGRKNGSVTEFRIGGFSAVAVLLDRQIEALEMIRLATSKNRTEKSQYKVKQETSDIKAGELVGYSTILTADKDTLNYSVADQGDFKTSLSKTWKVDVLFKDDKLVSISAMAEKSKTTVDKTNAKKTYVNVDEAKLVVTVKKVESQSNDHLYELVATSDGYLKASLDGNPNRGSLQSTLKFQFDIQDLEYLQGSERSKIAATKLEGSITFTDEKGKENRNVIAAGENEVNLDGLCSYVSGKVKFKSGSLQKDMILDDQKVVVEGTKYQVPLADCGHRPAVDLSRLFIW